VPGLIWGAFGKNYLNSVGYISESQGLGDNWYRSDTSYGDVVESFSFFLVCLRHFSLKGILEVSLLSDLKGELAGGIVTAATI